ncbi:hypothetical protein Bca52824_027681 [Brassica carinata]|uniref:Rab-GAP TBC domain-containing protein n=1 Tax=Brassica carinata TaxID=52824 RepID=A0A8X7VAY1_BRACI|nr:hypothetical protein Bca52824_027681 [Brassica carinata]
MFFFLGIHKTCPSFVEPKFHGPSLYIYFDDHVQIMSIIPTHCNLIPLTSHRYDLNSTEEERDSIRQQKQKEYENLRRQCREIHKRNENGCDSKQTAQSSNTDDSQVLDSHDIAEVNSSKRSIQVEEESEKLNSKSILQDGDCEESGVTSEDAANDSDSTNSEETETSPLLAKEEEAESHDTVSSDSTKSEETETSPLQAKDEAECVNSEETETLPLVAKEEAESQDKVNQEKDTLTPSPNPKSQAEEEFNTTWQRIIRLDAVRANDEWVPYSPSQAAVSDKKARGIATEVGLNDYEHLEPCRIFHAARLVGILEAYAVYDPEIGYCQGMSDLLSPLIAIWNQAAIRTGIAKATWGRIRLRAPPREDLLLYAIAASVLQRRKTIIEEYSGMDEIMKECNSMAGRLDVWKLLDDAHDLVVNLHDKI